MQASRIPLTLVAILVLLAALVLEIDRQSRVAARQGDPGLKAAQLR